MDAIPYNAKILDAMDIPVAINSDDAEMGRRLNQEAAKGVKYGGMSEASAWNMVTLNPAKLLHIDDRTGSIKVGKDADPFFGPITQCQCMPKQCMLVDGKIIDLKEIFNFARRSVTKAALIAKMLDAKKRAKRHKHPYECQGTTIIVETWL